MTGRAAGLRLDVALADTAAPGTGVLAVVGFGHGAVLDDAPHCLRVPLEPHGPAPLEVWRVEGDVRHGRDDEVRWSTNGRLSFGVIEVAEGPGGIGAAAGHAYAAMRAHVAASGTPHLLRIWNYLDAITEGEGDLERYRQFCVGRARGLGAFDPRALPAATAIGRVDGVRVLQVYWLSADTPGIPVENPRQVSAYRYPREYGPQPPSFARAMLPPPGASMPLMLSGTASVVGHRTLHGGDPLAQLDETFANFDALVASARRHDPALPPVFGAGTRLKAYVRDAADLPCVADALAVRLHGIPHVVLHAAVCRRDLAVEIDGTHAGT
jgi:chorismate lyase/3-hydroxybenzoate synthase